MDFMGLIVVCFYVLLSGLFYFGDTFFIAFLNQDMDAVSTVFCLSQRQQMILSFAETGLALMVLCKLVHLAASVGDKRDDCLLWHSESVLPTNMT